MIRPFVPGELRELTVDTTKEIAHDMARSLFAQLTALVGPEDATAVAVVMAGRALSELISVDSPMPEANVKAAQILVDKLQLLITMHPKTPAGTVQ